MVSSGCEAAFRNADIYSLGRPLGHSIFYCIGPKRMLFTNISQRLQGANLGQASVLMLIMGCRV